MKLYQKTYIEVEKGDKSFCLQCDNDASLGLIFDALMEMKGYCVERMMNAHKEEEAESEKKMNPVIEKGDDGSKS